MSKKTLSSPESKPKFKTITVSLETLEKNKLRLPDLLEQIEGVLVAQAMSKCENNKTHMADALGINRSTLVMKIYHLKYVGISVETGEIGTGLNHLFEV